MKTFKYEAMTLNGQRIDGEKSAASIAELAAALQGEGYYLLSHRELTLLDRARKKCFADEEALIFSCVNWPSCYKVAYLFRGP